MNQRRWSEADISAYIDDHLSPEKQARLEADLAEDAALRLEVEHLKQLVALMRAAPLRETPRNYLLTPAMVAEPKRERPRNRPSLFLMRLATAVTAASFVVTMGLNLLTSGFLFGGAMPAAQAPDTQIAMVQESEPTENRAPVEPSMDTMENTGDIGLMAMETVVVEKEAEPEKTETEEPVLVEEFPPGIPQAPGEGIGMGGAGGEAPENAPAPALGTGGGAPEADSALPEVYSEVLTTEMAMAPPEARTAATLPSDTEIATVAPAPEVETMGEDEDNGALPQEKEVSEAPPARDNMLGWLSAILGVLGVILGGATWWLSRHQS